MRVHQKKRSEHLHEVALRAKLSLRCFLASQPESAGSSGVVMKRASVLFCASQRVTARHDGPHKVRRPRKALDGERKRVGTQPCCIASARALGCLPGARRDALTALHAAARNRTCAGLALAGSAAVGSTAMEHMNYD